MFDVLGRVALVLAVECEVSGSIPGLCKKSVLWKLFLVVIATVTYGVLLV